MTLTIAWQGVVFAATALEPFAISPPAFARRRARPRLPNGFRMIRGLHAAVYAALKLLAQKQWNV
jgi:hypothetical protein